MRSRASTSPAWKPALRAALGRVRQRTLDLTAPLSDGELAAREASYLSPFLWDLGHIANFEELWLLHRIQGHEGGARELDELYNPFEQPRETRLDLPLPSRDETLAYMADVRERALALMDGVDEEIEGGLARDGFVYRMVAQHEYQHQETMLQSLDLRQESRPYEPAKPADEDGKSERFVDPEDEVLVEAGPFTMGSDRRAHTYDNERSAHVVDLPAYRIDRFPVSCERYAAFVDDGGYARERFWSEAGWAWRCENDVHLPQGWVEEGSGRYSLLRFGHVMPLDLLEPVQHLSCYEAEAFAAWAGGRLPSEAEWEKAAAFDPDTGESRAYPWGDEEPTPEHANLFGETWGPRRIGHHPRGASALGCEQMLGEVYEWTSSRFAAYPGFEAWPYREYSAVFFGDEYRVLRGASWAIGPLVARNTYRNWDYPRRHQVFAGLRLARDAH